MKHDQPLVARGSRLGVAAALALIALAGCAPARPVEGTDRLTAPLWESGGRMLMARQDHTATLLLSGKVLLAGGLNESSDLDTAELYEPLTGATGATRERLPDQRRAHTATLLQSGKVLIAGGMYVINPFAGPNSLATAVVYDPATDAFTPTASPLATARHGHTATLLASGKVLLTGGLSQANGGFLQVLTAEVYDPATDSFSVTAGGLAAQRQGHTATLLESGEVLVAGDTTAEVYDPATDGFSATAGGLAAQRQGHTATRLRTGSVLLAGGDTAGTAELYDRTTRTFAPAAGPMRTARSAHSATLLPSGKVLLTGGAIDGGVADSAELYNPGTGHFEAAPGALATGRQSHTATLLPSGQVLVAGGKGGGAIRASLEVYDPENGAFTNTTGLLPVAQGDHTATLLPSGKVLLAGGYANGYPDSALYDPTTDSFAPGADLTGARAGHTATLLPSGEVLLAGGKAFGIYPYPALYDPATDTAAPSGVNGVGRTLHTATLLPSGQVLVAGGENVHEGGQLDRAELYDRATDAWTPTAAPLTTRRASHTATLLPTGKVLLAGGYFQDDGDHILSSAELYDPPTGTFAPSNGALAHPRRRHTATLLQTGKVLLAGGDDGAASMATAELYDPATDTFASTPGSLATARQSHTATLLPSGRVLLVGGLAQQTPPPCAASVEIFDPLTGRFTITAPPATARWLHTATVLDTGEVLIAGGRSCDSTTYLDSAARFDERGAARAAWAPALTGSPGTVLPGGAVTLTGTRLGGGTEGASGTTSSSPTNYPIVQFRRVDGDRLALSPSTAWSATSVSTTAPATLVPGRYLVGVVVSGVPSNARALVVEGRPTGATCLSEDTCASGACADGICCQSHCGTCEACNLVGHVGECAVVPLGSQDADTCAGGSYCDGAGACLPRKAQAAACTVDGECASGSCADDVCCDLACTGACEACDLTGAVGICTTVPRGETRPGRCEGNGACDGAGICKKVDGRGCASDSECVSDHCVDDVCCESACAGTCQYCRGATPGVCAYADPGTDPRLRCQAASGGHAACAGKCDDAHQCAFPDVGTACGQCAVCDGTGRCTETPADDPSCGQIDCSGLDTRCRTYEDLTASRCATLGACKAPNDPATCTEWTDLSCTDGGVPTGDGAAGGDAGTGGGGGGCGCVAGRDAPGLLVATLLLGLLAPRRRRERG
jgi:MYXO-CTERM domain-containing protein